MAFLVSFCPFLCIGNLCLPSWALFHRSQKSQWQRVIGRPMPFFAGLHFDISCFFLSVHAFSDDLPLLHNEGWKDLRKALLELKMWWCLTDQLPVGILTCFLKTTLAAPPSSLFVDYNFLPKCISEFCLSVSSQFCHCLHFCKTTGWKWLHICISPSTGIILLKASW